MNKAKLSSHLHLEYVLALSQRSSCLYHTLLVYAEGDCLITLQNTKGVRGPILGEIIVCHIEL